MSEPDEFDVYDLSEFTPDDFASIDARLARARDGPAVEIVVEESPFQKFLSWKTHLAVTDLVAPLWCEVQYEYGLYGQRHKPLHLRPPAFTSRNGKRIHVHQPVARAHDQRLQRGKSVHKALEDELAPEKIIVHAVSEEERFGLRLLQLIDGFNQLVFNGIVRELPVFAITHAQVVLGVIDEVLRVSVHQPDQDQVVSPDSLSITHSGSEQQHPTNQITLESPTVSNTAGRAQDLYELRILDHKTRQSENVPVDEDALSSRLQLMMYHRMLSSVLDPEAFDFDLLWTRLNLDPTKPFSSQFAKDTLWDQRCTDPTDSDLHLNRLVSEWIVTVQRNRANLKGVSHQLQIVYRRSVYAGKRTRGKHKATESVAVGGPLALQEQLDLARAIEESLGETGNQGSNQIAHHVEQDIKQVGPSSCAVCNDLVSTSGSEKIEPELAWAIQESLLDCALKAHVQVDVVHGESSLDETKSKEQVQEGTTLDISPIIGTKEFGMNDEELDAHIADILQWWFGARPARGVDINQTNRCFTCEYRESCEWREHKAKEVADKSRNTDSGVWSTTSLDNNCMT